MPAIHRWTAAEVREMQDESRGWPRYELIGGELLVTPSPGWPHQFVLEELGFLLKGYTDRESTGITLRSPADLELLPETISQPDIFVLPSRREVDGSGDAWATALSDQSWTSFKSLWLAVEVISPSSVLSDRAAKRKHYLSADVSEYWIVDIESRLIERWTPSLHAPDIHRDTISWQPPGAAQPLTIDLVSLFERAFAWRRRAEL